MSEAPQLSEPTPQEIGTMSGKVLLEFGATWCGYCQAAQPLIAEALAGVEGVRHLRIEDGKGRRLGRHYRVKLWPTLVLLVEGQEIARRGRPQDVGEIRTLLSVARPG